MNDANDITLLRQFAERQSEPAFAEIVRRHLNLVYSVAFRFAHDSGEAQDIAQSVFILLAQKAGSLCQRASLTGWLYETTRFTAMKSLRTRARRAAREQQAIAQSSFNDSNAESLWHRLEPLLEEAMSRLSEKDRALIALHFFENKSHAETATALGIAEHATRKRVARAVEKLRVFFGKRGVAVSAVALAGVISANSVQAAPAALSKTVTVAAVTKAATASASTLTLIKGALKLMAWTKTKTATVVTVVAILAAGTATTFAIKHQHRRHAEETARAINIATAQSLQGNWRGTNSAHPGRTCTVNISGDQIEYRGADPADWIRGTFALNESSDPKQLDITILEPVKSYVLCIYQTNGDNIIIAAAQHGSRWRPVSFSASPQTDILQLQRD